MTYPDVTRGDNARATAARATWWRQRLDARRRHIAENRMRYFTVFGVIIVIVAAVFLIPMLLAS